MDYQPGNSVNITYNSNTVTFPFATGNETVQDIVTFMNNKFPNANFALRETTPGSGVVSIVELNSPAAVITFSTGSGTATGLNGTNPTWTLSKPSEIASLSTDLSHLADMAISDGKTIEIIGRNPDGSFVTGKFTYSIEKGDTTIEDFLEFINRTYTGVTATLEAGVIKMTDNAAAESLSSITIKSGTGEESSSGFNIDFMTEVFKSSTVFESSFGVAAPITTNINALLQVASTPYQVGDVIQFMATNMNGKTQKVEFIFGPNTPKPSPYHGETIQDIIDTINSSNYFPGLIASFENGQFVFTDKDLNDKNNHTSIQIVNGLHTIGRGLESNFTSNAGTNNAYFALPNFEVNVVGETGKHHSAIDVYDTAGQKHRVEIYYTQDIEVGSNKWFWEILIDEGKIKPMAGGSGTAIFHDNGSVKDFLYDNGSQLRFLPQGAAEVKISFNAGRSGSFEGMTSLDSPSTNILIEQDGYGLGVLNNIFIDDTGVITGIYSNGVSKRLAQIALANFTNEAGLQKEGHSYYAANGASGNAIVTWAGTNNPTVLKSGHLEESNVDLTDEFAQLIISQRALEANAKVVNTADMILQTIIERLKR
jgi:flagellar hook-basal body protein